MGSAHHEHDSTESLSYSAGVQRIHLKAAGRSKVLDALSVLSEANY